jgi:hypothetical protein
LIIDTGLNRWECLEAMQAGLRELSVDLEKVAALEVDRVLPWHRRLIRDHRARFAALRQHHENRLAEVLDILPNGPWSAFQVAARMTWDIRCESWEAFPVTQKWFATGEAISHLRYLEEEGSVTREAEKEKKVAGRMEMEEGSRNNRYRLAH